MGLYSDQAMNLLYGCSYHRSLKKLRVDERDRCHEAVYTLCRNPRWPGLNLEHLGKVAAHNHHSIRASKELRIILGLEPNLLDPKKVILVYAGHHDPAYSWSDQHGRHTDMVAETSFPYLDKKNDLLQRQKNFADAEEWQLFLHPEQQELVHKKFFGEARILGASGTGKTVIALHRAAWLGERYPQEKVLFTTYSRSLLNYLRYLYLGISDSPANVKFINIDKLARDIARDSRPNLTIDFSKEKVFFDEAWRETVYNTRLAKLSREYLKEEIERVIKGRDAKQDEYLDTDKFERIGRKQGFDKESREICWRLKEAFDARLQQAGLATFTDVLIAARDTARQNDGRYRAVLVDEYQDITLVGAQLLRALVVGNQDKQVPDNGLLFLGDAAQRIYVGGWKPAWANLKFSGQGRSEILQTNYRTTRRISDAAVAVRGTAKTGANHEEQITTCQDFALGDGEQPVFFKVESKMDIKTIAGEIKNLVENKSLRHEDIGILVNHNNDAEEINHALISKFAIPCFQLKDMRATAPGQGVRIGTFDRGKGLEFLAVFLPRLGASLFPGAFVPVGPQQGNIPGISPDSLSGEEQEHRQLQLDRLYVGMTRAVRFLYLLADEEPCEEFLNAEHCFEWRQ